MILARPDFAAAGTRAGIACSLTAAVLWSAYTVSARAAFRHTPSRVAFSVLCLYTTVGLIGAALVFSQRLFDLPAGLWPWAVVVASGALCIGAAHVLYYAAQKRIGTTVPSIILLASPLAVLSVSALAYGERLHPAQWLWGILLLVGCALAIFARRR